MLGDHPERLAGDLDGLGVGEAVVDAGEQLVGDLDITDPDQRRKIVRDATARLLAN